MKSRLQICRWCYGKRIAAGSPLSAVMTTTTQSDGCYLFPDLAPIDYVVQIAPATFAANGRLYHYLPSEPRDADPNQFSQ